MTEAREETPKTPGNARTRELEPTPEASERLAAEETEKAHPFKVEDRRHWARPRPSGAQDEGPELEVPSTRPTVVEEYRRRAEAAEQRLQDYIQAFKEARAEQEALRARLERDCDRRVDLRFAELVRELLVIVDDFDLALQHGASIAEAAPLLEGLKLARDRFLATLEKSGIQRIEPAPGEPFDPHTAEAVRTEPAGDPERDSSVVETVRPGYRLGDHILRAAQVVVARYERPA